MKKIYDNLKAGVLVCLALAIAGITKAQYKQGRVVYEHTMQLDGVFGMTIALPPSQWEVLYTNEKSLKRQLPPTDQVDQITDVEQNDHQNTFTELKTGLYILEKQLAGKRYQIADTVKKYNWTFTGATKEILGIVCTQATSTQISRMTLTSGDGEQSHVETTDSISVWFAPSIPVSAGPALQCQLPGLILEVVINNGKITYYVKELVTDLEDLVIKEPEVRERVTEQEFIKMSEVIK